MTLLLAVVLVLSLAACGAKGGDHMDGMDNEPKNAGGGSRHAQGTDSAGGCYSGGEHSTLGKSLYGSGQG
ncbi:MAG: hypothetical protein ACLUS6_10520 [Dysosmobacter sp.]